MPSLLPAYQFSLWLSSTVLWFLGLLCSMLKLHQDVIRCVFTVFAHLRTHLLISLTSFYQFMALANCVQVSSIRYYPLLAFSFSLVNCITNMLGFQILSSIPWKVPPKYISLCFCVVVLMVSLPQSESSLIFAFLLPLFSSARFCLTIEIFSCNCYIFLEILFDFLSGISGWFW